MICAGWTGMSMRGRSACISGNISKKKEAVVSVILDTSASMHYGKKEQGRTGTGSVRGDCLSDFAPYGSAGAV